MRAAVFHGPHDVRIENVPDPAAPAPGRGRARGDPRRDLRHGRRRNGITARSSAAPASCSDTSSSGASSDVGDDVTALRVGDRVVSGAGISCGRCRWCLRGRTNLCAEYRTLGLQVDGGLAEYVTSPASICHPVPDACDDDAAAMTQPLAVALHALSRVAQGPDDAVAVIGAGGIGSFIVAGAAQRAVDGRVVAIDIDDERLATASRARSRRDRERRRAATSPSCCSSSPTASGSTS